MALLDVNDLEVIYGKKGHEVRAVNGVSLEIEAGKILGLVGESGCGKSSLGKAVMGLIPAASGTIKFEGRSIFGLNKAEQKKVCRSLQMVFQDPYGSLNPRMQIGTALCDVMEVHDIGKSGDDRLNRAKELLGSVGLPEDTVTRYPHEFSGGQRQRICIARALTLNPSLIIADEPVSALDVSVQADILALLEKLCRERGLAFLFISHDLAVVRNLCDRVAVMLDGKVVELGAVADVIDHPQHAYTKKLLSAVPDF
jgi:ABC-type oligopeptide transport system ATPase subunit